MIHGASQNRAWIGFAGFCGFGPRAFSGSMHDRKSRAHARISSDSQRCPNPQRLRCGEGQILNPGAAIKVSLSYATPDAFREASGLRGKI